MSENVSKKKVNGRAKGKNGERELCKMLSETLGGHYVRVPSSGAMTGGINKARLAVMSNTQGRAFRGDIIPPDHLPKLYLEVKNYKDFKFHQLLGGDCPMLDSWIKQVIDGILDGDVWFICFKIKLKGWYVAFPKDKIGIYNITNHAVYNNNYCNVVVTSFNEFLTTNASAISTECS